MSSEPEKIRKAAEGLSQSLELLSDLRFPRLKSIPESFFEIWAANELIKYGFMPSVRKSKDYDILLSNGLKIEVKGSKKNYEEGLPWWGYNFRDGSQVRDKKFDFCILVRANDDGTPMDYFVLDIKEFKIDENFIKEQKEENYYIELSDSCENYMKLMKAWKRKETQLEIKMHKAPERFKNAWKNIRK